VCCAVLLTFGSRAVSCRWRALSCWPCATSASRDAVCRVQWYVRYGRLGELLLWRGRCSNVSRVKSITGSRAVWCQLPEARLDVQPRFMGYIEMCVWLQFDTLPHSSYSCNLLACPIGTHPIRLTSSFIGTWEPCFPASVFSAKDSSRRH
jgi:hypothetical protein